MSKNHSGLEKPERRRVGWRVLALLWVWVLCVAVVVDLFFNVSAFDKVRPRAPAYVNARAVAHRMVGERLANDPLRLQQEDAALRAEPPKTFRGTGLEWRINRSRVDAIEFKSILLEIDRLGHRDRLAALRYLHLKPDTSLAGTLGEIKDRVPRDVQSLANYSMACVSTIRALLRDAPFERGKKRPKGPRVEVATSDPGKQLLLNVLSTQADLVSINTTAMDEYAWAGVTHTLDRVERLFPGYLTRLDDAQRSHRVIASTVVEYVRTATRRQPGYRGGVQAIELASRIASGEGIGVLLDVLANRETVLEKFPVGRRDESVLMLLNDICLAVRTRGSDAQKSDLARLLRDGLDTERGPVRIHLWRQARLLAGRTTDRAALQVMSDAPARDKAEQRYKNAVGYVLRVHRAKAQR